MTIAYAMPFFCDAMLYLGALGCMGMLKHCRPGLVWAPLALAVGCWLSGRLTGRGKPWLRWAPMAAAIPAMLLAGNFAGRLVALPMLAYLPLYVYNNSRAPDYDYTADRFRHSMIVAGVALFMAMLIQARSWTTGLPYLFLYFTLYMALLRLLRHDDAVARSRRFRLLNLAGVGLACGAGFALAQPAVVAAVGAAWRWFAANVLLNLVALVMYGIELALYGLGWLLSHIPGLRLSEDVALPQLAGDEPPPQLAAVANEARALPPLVRFAIQAVGILLLAAVVLMLLRALSRQIARAELPTGTDEREALDDEAPPEPRSRRLRRAPEDGVRQWYRRALALTRARGGRVTRTMNTRQILEQNADVVDPEAMAELRALYLPVRYGEAAASREDARRARAAYERMRKA